MQPYQKANEEISRQGRAPYKAAASLVTTAGSFVGGSKLISKIMPFLNNYIPQSLAIKGLAKADERLGKFVNDAMESGKSFDEIKGFIGEKVKEGLVSQEAKKENEESDEKNIIRKYEPKLDEFITERIKNGSDIIYVIEDTHRDPRFHKVIEKLTKDYKMSWEQILDQVYGSKLKRRDKKYSIQTPDLSFLNQSPETGQETQNLPATQQNAEGGQLIAQSLDRLANLRQNRLVSLRDSRQK